MTVQSIQAVYNQGKLDFADANLAPTDGAQVVVTFVSEASASDSPVNRALRDLRGRGRGEKLLESLLAARKADRERNRRD